MKKVLSIIISAVLIASLVGCSKPNNSSSEYIAPTGANENSENEQLTEAPTEKPTEDSSVMVTRTEKYKLIDGQAFKDGIAWVTIKKDTDNEKHTALVNAKGEVLYFADNTILLEEKDDRIATTPFVNGLSAVYTTKSTGLSQYSSNHGFVIINTTGEEVYKCTDENMYMCGLANNGMFVVVKHDSGFDHDSWFVYTIEKDLKLHETKIQVDGSLRHCHDIKALSNELLYFVDCYGYLNLKTCSWITGSTNKMAITVLDENYAISGNGKEYVIIEDLGNYYLVPIQLLFDITKYDDIKSALKNSSSTYLLTNGAEGGIINNDDSISFNKWGFSLWNGGSFYREYSKDKKLQFDYLDTNGKKLLTFPEFPDGVKYESFDDFSGDYAAIYLTGVDGNSYVSIIDSNGKTQYEPIEIKENFWYGCSCNGYVFLYYYNSDNKEIEIISPDGTSMHLGEDLSGLGKETLTHTKNYKLYISDGFIYFSDKGVTKYTSIDGKTTLDEFTANYNSSNALIFTDKDGNKAVGSANAESNEETETTDSSDSDSSAQKSYINTDSFDIKGKWKNIGEYTYGQAQKGSIINFDGTNCNFYSPKDTYAFYKKGESYRLDCTSPLGDTASFTVKIVDDEHIDVSNGSDIVELKRVS